MKNRPAHESTPLRNLSRTIEEVMCKLNVHTVYCKYGMKEISWKNLGYHCQYCDKPLSNKGQSWYRMGGR